MAGRAIQARELPVGLGSQRSDKSVEDMGRQEGQGLPIVSEAPQVSALA